MRTVKFRAWDKNEKVMRYTDYSKYPETCDIILPYYGFFGTSEGGFITAKHKKGKVAHDTFVFGKPGVLMQYTCLNAIGDVEVYEGDVVRTFTIVGFDNTPDVYENIEGYVNFVVQWDEDQAAFILGDHEQSFSDTGTDDMEVIGNIYENPELTNTI